MYFIFCLVCFKKNHGHVFIFKQLINDLGFIWAFGLQPKRSIKVALWDYLS